MDLTNNVVNDVLLGVKVTADTIHFKTKKGTGYVKFVDTVALRATVKRLKNLAQNVSPANTEAELVKRIFFIEKKRNKQTVDTFSVNVLF